MQRFWPTCRPRAPFVGQLQTIANEARIQTGGDHGEVTARDNAKVQGQSAGINKGTMSGTFTFTEDDDK